MIGNGSKNVLYHLIALFTVIIWGITFISTKVLLANGLSPADIFFFRFLLAYILLRVFGKGPLFSKSWKDELLMMAAGATGGSLYFLAENTALGLTLASNVSLIISTTPILTAFVIRAFNRSEKLNSKLIWGSVIALCGVAFVVFNGSVILKLNPLGDLLTLIAALFWAFYSYILVLLNRTYTTVFITRKVFFYGVLTILPVFIFSPLHLNGEIFLQPAVIGNLLFLGVVASLFCFVLWNGALKELGTIKVTNYLYFVPLVTLLASYFILQEPVTPVALAGCVLILTGVYIAERGFRLPRMKK